MAWYYFAGRHVHTYTCIFSDARWSRHGFLYAYNMIYRYLKGRGDDMRREADEAEKSDKDWWN